MPKGMKKMYKGHGGMDGKMMGPSGSATTMSMTSGKNKTPTMVRGSRDAGMPKSKQSSNMGGMRGRY